MEHILNEIERALDAGLYIVALQSTLTLPGICAALESDNGFNDNNDKATYIEWYDKNVKPYVDYRNLLNVHPHGIPGFVEGIKMIG